MMSYDRSDAIVRTILSLGRALNIDIIAEGVETLPQRQRLREMECPCGVIIELVTMVIKLVTIGVLLLPQATSIATEQIKPAGY
jgi:hypothetical protein